MGMLDSDIRSLALSRGVREVAFDDVILQFPNDDETSFTDWLAKMKPDRPHWFKATQSSLADDAPELFSIDAQGRYAKANGTEALVELLAANNLRPGEVLKAPKPDGSVKGASNPWSREFRGTDDERQAKMATLIRSLGTKACAGMAASAGVTLGMMPLRKK